MLTENGTYTLLLLEWLRSSYEKDSTDPMWHKYPHLTPYHYCSNNPIMFVDPTGLATIYAPDGTFLGTDDEGLRRAQLILDRADFTQGMAHADAQNNNITYPFIQRCEP